MANHIVTRLLQVCGPCRVLLAGTQSLPILQDLLLAGCDAYAFDSFAQPHPRWINGADGMPDSMAPDVMLVQVSSANNLQGQLNYYFQRFGTPKVLALLAKGHDRRAIENPLFASLWRRHPGGMTAYEYEALSDYEMGELSFYEQVPEEALQRWPISALMEDRNLHMDMLRESGCRADAHIVRYSLAAQFVRPGDVVLDCASGLGYGTAVLASLSSGSKFIGVELDPATVDYANANYARDGLTYQAGDASDLKAIPDSSIDIVVSMETIEHVPDWNLVLKEFHRVLKPGGRLVGSVPDRWVDETGNDPNPYHFHAFDWAKFEGGLNAHFFVEMRYAQAAPGGFKLTDAARLLRPVEINSDIDTEWLLAVASKSPLEGMGRTDFKHPAFNAAYEKNHAVVVDFGHYYDNPYLYRSMVQIGDRVRDSKKLSTLASWVITNARPDSADRGAAICVYGYQALEKCDTAAAASTYDIICDYIRVTSEEQKNPHVLRWRLSLAFLAGRLSELVGDRQNATRWYRATLECDWRNFSPILATKTVAACFFEGRIWLADGDMEQAKACFARGLSEAMTAVQGNMNDIVGNPEQPIPFGLTELAEVIDMGSQCANAIANLHLWKRDPGLFWKHVDVKRFGLISWAMDLERENQRLLAVIAK